MVDGKSTSAKSGLEFTTPGFPAPHRLTSRLSAHHQHRGNTTALRPQLPASTAFPRASGRHTATCNKDTGTGFTPSTRTAQSPVHHTRCTTSLLTCQVCIYRAAFGGEAHTCPMQTAAQRGERAPSSQWRGSPPGTAAPSLLSQWLGPREHCRRTKDHLLPTPHSSGSLQQQQGGGGQRCTPLIPLLPSSPLPPAHVPSLLYHSRSPPQFSKATSKPQKSYYEFWGCCQS